MWEKIKSIFLSSSGPTIVIEPLHFRDGVLVFRSPSKLRLSTQKLLAPSKIGDIEVTLKVLSFDEKKKIYRAELDNEVFSLDAMKLQRDGEFRLKVAIGVTSNNLPGGEAVTEDLSLMSTRLTLKKPVEVGAYLPLTLHFRDPGVPDLEISGEVRWCAPRKSGYHCAVHFIAADKAQRVAISRFIKNRVALGANLPS